jgi:glutathione S-transferase
MCAQVKKVNLLAYGEKPDWFFKVSPSGLLPVRRGVDLR